jgi:hypothetical protein
MSSHPGRLGQAGITLILAFALAACSGAGQRDAEPPPRSQISSGFSGLNLLSTNPGFSEATRR